MSEDQYCERLEEIERLITDERFQMLKYRQEKAKTNLFSIVGRSHTEMWHSAFISWLLDPNSSLRLGHFPLARLLTYYAINKPEAGLTLRDIYNFNLDKVKFITEKEIKEIKHNSSRRIDVYGESDELIIVIENKVNARENYNDTDKGQTQDYYDYIEKNRKSGQKSLYFFITADQRQLPFCKEFLQMSYQDMFDQIICKCIQHPQVPDDGRFLLEHYASNLTKTIHNSNTPMALVNIDLCKEIYDEHADVMDRIFEQVDKTIELSGSKEPECMVYEHYSNIFDEIYLSVEEKYGVTPSSKIGGRQQRQGISFTELYKRGIIKDGMRFFMEFEGERYEAVFAVVNGGEECFLHPLDENGREYCDKKSGRIWGYYDNSFQAAVDVINDRRTKKGISERIRVLRDGTDWKSVEGQELRSILEK